MSDPTAARRARYDAAGAAEPRRRMRPALADGEAAGRAGEERMKRALMVAAALAATTTVHAQTAGTPPPLGRLFYTPAERAQLDIARMQRKPTPAPASSSAEPAVPESAPQVVTYRGIVRRSDGRATLWINNRAVDEKEALSGLNLKGSVRPDGAVSLQV